MGPDDIFNGIHISFLILFVRTGFPSIGGPSPHVAVPAGGLTDPPVLASREQSRKSDHPLVAYAALARGHNSSGLCRPDSCVDPSGGRTTRVGVRSLLGGPLFSLGSDEVSSALISRVASKERILICPPVRRPPARFACRKMMLTADSVWRSETIKSIRKHGFQGFSAVVLC